MFRRSLTAGLSLAAVLAGLASAKPPDLPMPQNDTLTPADEAPLFFRVRPSVRRTMASCLLFGVNPALALAPTRDYVDFDADDVEPGTIPALFAAPAADEAPNGRVIFGVGFKSDAGLAGAVEPDAPAIKPTGAPDEATPSVCPYMRQRQGAAGRSATPLTETDLSDDVLHNLEMLRQAQLLLQNAREFGEAGHVGEALQCLSLVHDLCPSGWLDGRVQEAAAEVFAACYGGSPRDVGAAAKQPETAARTIQDKLLQPVSFRYDGAPLGQVIDDLRSSRGVNISVDKAALDAEEVSLDHPVSVQLDNLPLKSALDATLKPLRLTAVVTDNAVRITTERGASAERDRESLRPCPPPVDPQLPAVLDRLYDEVIPASADEENGPAEPPPGAAKPFLKAADMEEVGACKDAGAPISYLEVLKEFAAIEPPAHGELYFGLDGSVRMFTQLCQGGAVWHVLYKDGGLSVWASPDGGAPADDDSAD